MLPRTVLCNQPIKHFCNRKTKKLLFQKKKKKVQSSKRTIKRGNSFCFLFLPKALTHADKRSLHILLSFGGSYVKIFLIQIFTCWSISSVAFSFNWCPSRQISKSRIFSPWASTWSVRTLTCNLRREAQCYWTDCK